MNIFPPERDLPEGRHQLLKELVMTALENTPAPASEPSRPRRKLLRTGVLAPALGLAAAAAVALPLLFGGTPAHAVAKNPDGTISITLNEAKDPKALESDLRRMGYNIVVDYLPEGKKCATRPRGTTWVPKEEAPLSVFPPTVDTEGFQIDPQQIKPGQTGVLEFAVNENPELGSVVAGIWARVSNGPVAPCDLIDGSAPLGD
ncbi:hypothetical protein Nocox_36250 [Nonomuraea coxensis DSM 45129]|uniref:PASTA domain-containing protein n=1 Tax=Nonomuraea coxensis DSM 45129 TaxID=1122611 RepID=A0ABX8UDK9_9ACTN|nr:hypothetical protein [Nonomuraea coxensis]QYC44804.1 hypothetical protein Nocox_36250 [Nonomuraea coxensis DSM 45129]